jgi:23S rRNA (uridine2552-2'-O)-methyltransferase
MSEFMTRSASSQRWLARQKNDPYVKKAQKEGLRSRASYKLIEINQKHKILKPGIKILDCGAAPGGWSEAAMQILGVGNARIVAVDLLPMDPIAGVEFVLGDLYDQQTWEHVLTKVGSDVDLLLSDMAPNMSGNKLVDQLKSAALVELALDAAQACLKKNGTALIKVFQGGELQNLIATARTLFASITLVKPNASRSGSREQYLLAKGYNKNSVA